jgi:hypothetical protein
MLKYLGFLQPNFLDNLYVCITMNMYKISNRSPKIPTCVPYRTYTSIHVIQILYVETDPCLHVIL